MLPLMLDPARLRLLLIGNGAAALRRLALLDDAGAANLTVHAEAPTADLAAAAGARLVRRLPDSAEIAAAHLVFIADVTPPHRAHLAAIAHAARALVHVEDEPALCSAYAPATLRRGDLTIAVSTGGRSPGFAAHLKRFLAALFGPEWQRRIDDLAALRRGWRDGGADPDTIAQWTEEWVARSGWLPPLSTVTGGTSPDLLSAANDRQAGVLSKH